MPPVGILRGGYIALLMLLTVKLEMMPVKELSVTVEIVLVKTWPIGGSPPRL
jgi:hypothetical protein